MNRFITTDFFKIIQMDRELERRRRERSAMVSGDNCISTGNVATISWNNCIANGTISGNMNIGGYAPATNLDHNYFIGAPAINLDPNYFIGALPDL